MNKHKANDILIRIVSKGGLIGKCGEYCMNNPQKATEFIIECSNQCHNQLSKNLWGDELVSDIMKYAQYQIKMRSPIMKKPKIILAQFNKIV